MPQKTYCIYCNEPSTFTVMLRNERELIVGSMHSCENCRHLLPECSGMDLWWKNKRIKTRITDVPPVIHSLN